jgi:hypothetical protein
MIILYRKVRVGSATKKGDKYERTSSEVEGASVPALTFEPLLVFQ